MEIKKLFVSYELALLAKEKGYLEQCLADYTIQNKELELRDTAYNKIWSKEISIEKKPKYIAAPLYSQLVDWFRKEHKLNIYIQHNCQNGLFYGSISIYNEGNDNEIGLPKGRQLIIEAESEYYESMNKTLKKAFTL